MLKLWISIMSPMEDILLVKFKIEEFVQLIGPELGQQSLVNWLKSKHVQHVLKTNYKFRFNPSQKKTFEYCPTFVFSAWIQPQTSGLSRGARFEGEEHLQEAADQENEKKSKPDAEERLNDWDDCPEFTGRVCPAPCEGACSLGIGSPAFCINSIVCAIIHYAVMQEWMKPSSVNAKTKLEDC
ncbi:hypothetical protein B9Z55_022639 [Caenorhabditis nigoni]|uniref:Dihydroprymidine dehydrogenase domain-containing protein n=1 Tax=Caenorhabditis nigoni TaxID=1611254 RepID=A0A2G5SLQ7_9PELO|nr:hypothetical protein B9Z55_022639 [Caenorhabditis nigoni]